MQNFIQPGHRSDFDFSKFYILGLPNRAIVYFYEVIMNVHLGLVDLGEVLDMLVFMLMGSHKQAGTLIFVKWCARKMVYM